MLCGVGGVKGWEWVGGEGTHWLVLALRGTAGFEPLPVRGGVGVAFFAGRRRSGEHEPNLEGSRCLEKSSS